MTTKKEENLDIKIKEEAISPKAKNLTEIFSKKPEQNASKTQKSEKITRNRPKSTPPGKIGRSCMITEKRSEVGLPYNQPPENSAANQPPVKKEKPIKLQGFTHREGR